MSTFTPGPWKTDADCADESVLAADGLMVADCAIFGSAVEGKRPDGFRTANARLISASPEMYEALIVLTGALVEHAPHAQISIRTGQAALAKAEGRS